MKGEIFYKSLMEERENIANSLRKSECGFFSILAGTKQRGW